MKKLLLSLAALVMSTGAVFAQSETDPTLPATGVSFSVAGQTDNQDGSYTISSRTADVTITLADFDSESYYPFILYSNGAGFAINEPMPIEFVQEAANKFVVELNDEKWGNPYVGNYYCTLMVAFINNEDEFFTVDDEPFFYQGVYITANTNPAELVSVYPNNDWSEETFAQAYNRGTIQFSFDNIVSFADNANAVSITWRTDYGNFSTTYSYNPNAGEDEETVDLPYITLGWNPMDGNYMAEISIKNPDFDADEIESITISMNGVRSLGDSVQVPSITLNNLDDVNAYSVRKNSKGANTASVKELGCVENEAVEVYNLQGMLLKTIKANEVNSLKPGLYIVNGKKFIVR